MTANEDPKETDAPASKETPQTPQSDDPFLGKLVVPPPQTPLQTPQPPVQKAAGVVAAPVLPPQASKVTPTPPPPPPAPKTEKKPSAEDLLHGGNVVSLLENEAKKMGETPVAPSEATTVETPIQRSIREIGLEPRPEKILQRRQDEKKRMHEESYRDGLPRIRTYASDMSEEIKKRGETLSTIISAEREKMGRGPVGNETAEKSDAPQQSRNVFLAAGAGVLLLLGIGIISTAVYFSIQPPPQAPHVSLVQSNSTTFVPFGDDEIDEVLWETRNSLELSLGEIADVVLTENALPMSGEKILTELGAPNVLARNAMKVMTGVHAFDRNQPFILVSVAAYDRAFEGMLEWERTIGDDLGAFFAPSRLTASEQHATPPRMEFKDLVIQNIDVRDSGSAWRIVYTFPRRDLLLITTNESTIREILTRLALQ